MEFSEAIAKFQAEFGLGRKMVLSTANNNIVSSRMMSVVLIEGKFYFQTDKMLRKYEQLCNNKNVALCIDNIQIEGVCKEVGLPSENTAFCAAYQACFRSSYVRYTTLTSERLFKVTPTYIERWLYIEGEPYIETWQIVKKEYALKKYKEGL